MLDTLDLGVSLSKPEYEAQLAEFQGRLRHAHELLVAARRPLVVVYEGWDAAGKGGSIKRLTERLDPRFFTVYGVGKPTPEELAHHYLWRFWTKLPTRDHTVIFDRSWYGRVLVERVEGFASQSAWQRAFNEINEFERWLVDDGALLCKFWLHISPDEQLRRFEGRLQDPAKRWKMNDEDWRNRGKWQQYSEAAETMFNRTSTPYAPWSLIAGEDKRWARIACLRVVTERIEAALAQHPVAD